MILVDAGFFIAVADRDDQLHVRAIAWSLAAARLNETLLVTEYVFLEAVNALCKPSFRQRAIALAGVVRSHPSYLFIAASPALLDAGLSLFASRGDKAWSLTDCISFHVMKTRGITEALAFDRHFEQAGFEALLRRDP